ncbi:hypothetical protein PG990_012071 [Apiospora arundinis]
MASTMAARWGFPGPGFQEPRPEEIISDSIFMSSQNWHELENFNDYDYVVVGTGCTALAFVHEVLRNDPQKKNLSVPFRGLIGGDAETYPWTLSEKTHQSQLGYCHGYYPFFGGRSLFWSGWCPQPQAQALRGLPSRHAQSGGRPQILVAGPRGAQRHLDGGDGRPSFWCSASAAHQQTCPSSKRYTVAGNE